MRSFRAYINILSFDLLAMALGFVLSGWISLKISGIISGAENIPSLEYILDRFYSFVAFSFVVLYTFHNRGHYKSRVPWWNQVRFILIVMVTVLFLDGFVHFAIKYPFSRLWILFSWAVSFFLILLGRFVSRKICEKAGVWTIPTIVIGSGDNVIDTLFAVGSDSYTGYDIKTLILHCDYKNFNRNILPLQYTNISIIDGADEYSDYIRERKDSFFIIAPDSFSDLDIEKIVEALDSVRADYAIVPPIKGMSLYGNRPQYFFGHDIMLIQKRPKITSPLGRVLKRGMDILGAIVLLSILWPVFLIISLIILKDGGAVLFRNRRIGRDGKEFDCLKFRSMVLNAEEKLQELLDRDAAVREMWETHRKMKYDPRVTKIGRILRKTSLDELPQIINVLKGEMSLVGPRPILPDETIFFEKGQLDNYKSVSPGITGLWQVSGRNDATFKKRVHMDDWYIKNWSLWYDIVILFKTIVVLLKRKGVY